MLQKKCKPGTSLGLVQQQYSELINKKQTIVWQLFWCMCLFTGLPPVSDKAGERLFSWNGPPPPSPSWSNSAGPRRDLRGTWHNLLSGRLIFQKMTSNSIEWTANVINCNHDHAEIVYPLTPFIHLNRCKIEIWLSCLIESLMLFFPQKYSKNMPFQLEINLNKSFRSKFQTATTYWGGMSKLFAV